MPSRPPRGKLDGTLPCGLRAGSVATGDMPTLLEVRGLQTQFVTDAGVVRAVDGVSFTIDARRDRWGSSANPAAARASRRCRSCGSSRSRRAGSSAARSSSRGATCSTLPSARCARVRGNEIAMIFQEPMTSLNPVFTIGDQIVEALAAAPADVADGGARARRSRCCELVGIPDAAARVRRLSAPALRRHASARDDRDGARLRARAAHRRRADDGARRDHPGADSRPAREPEGALGHGALLITHDLGVVAEHADAG